MKLISIRKSRTFEGPNLLADYPVLQLHMVIQANACEDLDKRVLGLMRRIPPQEQVVIEPERADLSVILSSFVTACVSALHKELGFSLPPVVIAAKDDHIECLLPFEIPSFCRAIVSQIVKMLNEKMVQVPLAEAPSFFEDWYAKQLNTLKKIRERLSLGSPGLEFLEIAAERGIPAKRLSSTKRHLLFGYGRKRKVSENSLTSVESHLAANAANNKELTAHHLRFAGLPVPDHQLVHTEEQALLAARKFGYPVVVKPLFGLKGMGVSPNLKNDQELIEAYHKAARQYPQVLVEEFVEGEDHRLQISGGTYIGCLQRTRASVTGDGQLTIRQLIEQTNKEPWRRDPAGRLIYAIPVNDETGFYLRKNGRDWSDIPAKDEKVQLQDVANVSQGGRYEDLSDLIHPANIRMAERAAETLGIQVAGVDFLTTDISKPYWESGGRICEVNVMPALRGLEPYPENPRYQIECVFNLLFPPGKEAQIPTTAVFANRKSGSASWLKSVFEFHNLSVGLQTDRMAEIGDDPCSSLQNSIQAAEAVLWNPACDAVILQSSISEIEKFGLAYSQIDYLIIEERPAVEDERALQILDLLKNQVKKTVFYNAEDAFLDGWAAQQSSVETTGLYFGDETDFLAGFIPVEERLTCLLAIEVAKACSLPIGQDCLTHLSYETGEIQKQSSTA